MHDKLLLQHRTFAIYFGFRLSHFLAYSGNARCECPVWAGRLITASETAWAPGCYLKADFKKGFSLSFWSIRLSSLKIYDNWCVFLKVINMTPHLRCKHQCNTHNNTSLLHLLPLRQSSVSHNTRATAASIDLESSTSSGSPTTWPNFEWSISPLDFTLGCTDVSHAGILSLKALMKVFLLILIYD